MKQQNLTFDSQFAIVISVRKQNIT